MKEVGGKRKGCVAECMKSLNYRVKKLWMGRYLGKYCKRRRTFWCTLIISFPPTIPLPPLPPNLLPSFIPPLLAPPYLSPWWGLILNICCCWFSYRYFCWFCFIFWCCCWRWFCCGCCCWFCSWFCGELKIMIQKWF